jgi:predicted DNA-binding protein with PD1-like motif
MKFARLTDTAFALRLEPGDDIHETLQKFCASQGIANAHITGIGSIDSPALAHYSMRTKQFSDRRLEGIYEAASLLGNVALVEGQPFAHLHVTVADSEMAVRAGHLVKGRCSATLELIVTSYPTRYTKSQNDEIGLKIWDFAD